MGQAKAGQRAQQQGAQNLDNGVDHNGEHIHHAGAQGLGNTEGHGKEHQAHRVVQRHNGQQQIRQGTFRFILAHHHQRGGRGGGGGDGAQGDGSGDGQCLRLYEAEGKQGRIHQQCCHHGLDHANNKGLAAGLLQLRQTKLIADGKGDKAQGHITDQTDILQLVIAGKADAGDMQRTDAAGADEHTGHQVGRHIRQVQPLDGTGHHQSREHGNGKRKQTGHKEISSFFSTR